MFHEPRRRHPPARLEEGDDNIGRDSRQINVPHVPVKCLQQSLIDVKSHSHRLVEVDICGDRVSERLAAIDSDYAE